MRWSLILLAAAAPATGAGAQGGVPVEAGDRVRVTPVSGPRDVFVVVRANADTLVLTHARRGTTHVAALAQVKRLERSSGPRPPGDAFFRGAGYGALAGTLAGGTMGFATASECAGTNDFCWDPMEGAMVFGLLGGLFGGVIGGVVGLASPGERWERVQLPVRPPAGAAR